MTDQVSGYRGDALKYAQQAMTWYGWGSPISLGLFILATGGFAALLHVTAVIP
jgi:hypothetical protein